MSTYFGEICVYVYVICIYSLLLRKDVHCPDYFQSLHNSDCATMKGSQDKKAHGLEISQLAYKVAFRSGPTTIINHGDASHDIIHSAAVNQTSISCYSIIKVLSLETPYIDFVSFADMNSKSNVSPENLISMGSCHIPWWIARSTK